MKGRKNMKIDITCSKDSIICPECEMEYQPYPFEVRSNEIKTMACQDCNKQFYFRYDSNLFVSTKDRNLLENHTNKELFLIADSLDEPFDYER